MIPERVRAALDRRRGNAAGVHKQKLDDWELVEFEELNEVSGDLDG